MWARAAEYISVHLKSIFLVFRSERQARVQNTHYTHTRAQFDKWWLQHELSGTRWWWNDCILKPNSSTNDFPIAPKKRTDTSRQRDRDREREKETERKAQKRETKQNWETQTKSLQRPKADSHTKNQNVRTVDVKAHTLFFGRKGAEREENELCKKPKKHNNKRIPK